jgi:hypothetical protein
MRRRLTSTLVGAALVLVGCGSSGDDVSPAAAPESTAAPTETTASDATDATGESTATTPAAPTDSATTAAPPTIGSTETAATATPEPPTEPAEARATDGCATDNTATDVAAGPAPAIEVRAAAADNPLPDLAVRRVNCAGGWVNLKNELPGELPLLVWFWAPH